MLRPCLGRRARVCALEPLPGVSWEAQGRRPPAPAHGALARVLCVQAREDPTRRVQGSGSSHERLRPGASRVWRCRLSDRCCRPSRGADQHATSVLGLELSVPKTQQC